MPPMRGWLTWTIVSGPSGPAARAAEAKISRGGTARVGDGIGARGEREDVEVAERTSRVVTSSPTTEAR